MNFIFRRKYKAHHTRLYNGLSLLEIVTTLPIPEPQTSVVTFNNIREKNEEDSNILQDLLKIITRTLHPHSPIEKAKTIIYVGTNQVNFNNHSYPFYTRKQKLSTHTSSSHYALFIDCHCINYGFLLRAAQKTHNIGISRLS